MNKMFLRWKSRTPEDKETQRSEWQPGGRYWPMATEESQVAQPAARLERALQQIAWAQQELHCNAAAGETISAWDVECATRRLASATAHIVRALMESGVVETEN